jgi:hypothetical protein
MGVAVTHVGGVTGLGNSSFLRPFRLRNVSLLLSEVAEFRDLHAVPDAAMKPFDIKLISRRLYLRRTRAHPSKNELGSQADDYARVKTLQRWHDPLQVRRQSNGWGQLIVVIALDALAVANWAKLRGDQRTNLIAG